MAGLLALMASGGPVIGVLLALSLLSLAVIVAKLVQLWPVRAGARRRERALAEWAAGQHQAARDRLAAGRAPADRVAGWAMQGLAEGLPRAALDDEATRRGNLEIEAMSRGLRLLELVAMISPLLGLLGTVLGMIQSFRQLEMAGGAANASVLAGGIWQALLTTAAGLLVAIPAAVAASLLAARVEAAGSEIETAVGRLWLIEFGRPEGRPPAADRAAAEGAGAARPDAGRAGSAMPDHPRSEPAGPAPAQAAPPDPERPHPERPGPDAANPARPSPDRPGPPGAGRVA